MLVYCIVGNLCYGMFKIQGTEQCLETRKSEISKQRDPCGMIVRTWVPFDVSTFPRLHIKILLLYSVTKQFYYNKFYFILIEGSIFGF